MINVDSVDGSGGYVLGIARASSGQDSGSCCEARGAGGCGDSAVEACVCALDAYCCETEWDAFCASAVETNQCGSC